MNNEYPEVWIGRLSNGWAVNWAWNPESGFESFGSPNLSGKDAIALVRDLFCCNKGVESDD